ncbi:crotonobetainyl-CoA:carnitine CoA-transferase CaiB-like acyl-CoA transferase [Paraburkholderia sp. BL25I1N1]|nr:crotonobetainyl-CoA:carnitine CoA-transferase CaiB-like acyl-CoA transferase [Paraburkholderia sp. BL25I1N1]
MSLPNQLPLRDIVVIELGHSVAAPFAGQIFADLGATVIKVEKSSGDDARGWGPPFWEGAASLFQTLNRNKQSVVCNLRDAQQLLALKRLIHESADVVIQNLRPGQVAKLGLDAKTLRAEKPELIYCNMGAFGNKGPLKDHPGYDPLMQAFGGIMSTTGEPGQRSVRVGPSIVDMGTGMWAAIGVLTALYQRKSSGSGADVDVSLFETAVSWMSVFACQYMSSGEVPGKSGSGSASIVPYKSYLTEDGELVVAAGNDALFQKLCVVIGMPELASDPQYIDNKSRVLNHKALYAILDPVFLQRPSDEWTSILETAGIPCAPVNDTAEMVNHPQTADLGIIAPVPGTDMRMVGLPITLNGERPTPYRAPPMLGEHTDLHLFSTAAAAD